MELKQVYSLHIQSSVKLVHLAKINEVTDAGGLCGEIAMTKCNRVLKWFNDCDDTSDYYTDGTLHKNYCKKCFKP